MSFFFLLLQEFCSIVLELVLFQVRNPRLSYLCNAPFLSDCF